MLIRVSETNQSTFESGSFDASVFKIILHASLSRVCVCVCERENFTGTVKMDLALSIYIQILIYIYTNIISRFHLIVFVVVEHS